MKTRSGGPEVTISGVPMKTVLTAYIHELADEGFAVGHDKAGNMIGVKDAGVARTRVSGYVDTINNVGWINGRMDGTQATVRLSFLKEDDGVRVLYRGFIGGEEAREDWKARQAMLERVAEQLEAGR
jgi:hypothetical protein